MGNKDWNIVSEDNNPVHVVLFISRNKDNSSLENYVERRKSFITKEAFDSDKIKKEFMNFVNRGLEGEMSRLYFSVNERDESKIYKSLLHFLIDNPEFNLCSIKPKIAGIAAEKHNAKTKRWMFDFDIDDYASAEEFCNDIKAIDENVETEIHKTPNAYAIITSRGFDTRELLKKWNENKRLNENVELKRDDLLCVDWKIKRSE